MRLAELLLLAMLAGLAWAYVAAETDNTALRHENERLRGMLYKCDPKAEMCAKVPCG